MHTYSNDFFDMGTSPVEDSSIWAAKRSAMARALLTDGTHLLETRGSGDAKWKEREIGQKAADRQIKEQ
jgi:hypothetical protein